MKKLKTAMIVIPIITVIILFFIIKYVTSDRIETYPAGMTGNTAGNLNNGGYFSEYDGVVYFANAYDSGTLYSMNADESNMKKLTNQVVMYLNVAGSHIYYYQTANGKGSDLGNILQSSGLYRCSTNGSNLECLKKGTVATIALVDNQLYYQNYDKSVGFTLYKMSTKGTGDTQVADYIINPACVSDSGIYFNGTKKDHNLYRLDAATDQISRIWAGSMWNPVLSNGFIYYMDLTNNYSISRVSLATGESEILVSGRVDMFNLSDQYLFYQTSGDSPALKRVNLDGSGEVTIAEGTYHNLCLTSQYLYYTSFLSDTPMYHLALNSTTPTVFEATVSE